MNGRQGSTHATTIIPRGPVGLLGDMAISAKRHEAPHERLSVQLLVHMLLASAQEDPVLASLFVVHSSLMNPPKNSATAQPCGRGPRGDRHTEDSRQPLGHDAAPGPAEAPSALEEIWFRACAKRVREIRMPSLIAVFAGDAGRRLDYTHRRSLELAAPCVGVRKGCE